MHTVTDVLSIIGQVAARLPVESVLLAAARDRVLHAPVVLDIDAPPFDRSMLDGYAVRAADALIGAKLRIVGRQDAGGELCSARVVAGACVAISTGAPVPEGADAILMVEHAARTDEKRAATPAVVGEEYIQAIKAVSPGWGIQKRASDAAQGQVVLPPGILLGAVQMAVAASAGAAKVSVYRRPRVAVLTTGDEVVPVEANPGPAQIRNSNGPMLAALVERFAVLACDPAWVPDLPVKMRQDLERLLVAADVVLVTGSLSMGTRDFVPALAAEMGFTTHVQTVRIKPGKPFMLATRETSATGGRQYLIGLPGNPVSAMVCFHRFVRPLLARLAGQPVPELSRAVTTAALRPNGDREFYQPAILDRIACPPSAAPLEWKGSADIFTLARANALIVHPESAAARPPGTPVQVLEI